MKVLTNAITIIVEIIVLILSIAWYINTAELEPLIGIVSSGGTFILSIVLKFSSRPRIVMHHTGIHSSRWRRGYTGNNPPIIKVGEDNPDIYWELNWNYVLEIRNNSSLTAYNISIDYVNLPNKTFIEGEFGKIEPFQTHEKREFNVKIIQNVTGTHIDADAYLKNNPTILTKKFKIHINYKDEFGFPFSTIYYWKDDKNKVTLSKLIWACIFGAIAILGIIVGMITYGFHGWRIFPKTKHPLIDIRINPLKYNYNSDSNSNYHNASLPLAIQTSNGTYQIIDEIKIDTFIVLNSDYFVIPYAEARPTSKISEVVINKRILDSSIPEQSGLIKVQNDFILTGNKTLSLYNSKREEIIAKMIVSIPYRYEGNEYVEKKEVPFFVYYR